MDFKLKDIKITLNLRVINTPNLAYCSSSSNEYTVQTTNKTQHTQNRWEIETISTWPSDIGALREMIWVEYWSVAALIVYAALFKFSFTGYHEYLPKSPTQ